MTKKTRQGIGTEAFILKAQEKHGTKFDYSKVEYTNCKKKVIITCPIHGEALQTPEMHLSTSGCRLCGMAEISRKATQPVGNRLHEAVLKHNDKYDYSLTDTTAPSKSKMLIICPEHGEFKQTFNDHVKGKGCPSCGTNRTADARRMTQAQFVKKSEEVHAGKYDYSKTSYTLIKNSVVITCPIHGDFIQVAEVHLRGNGCNSCGVASASDKTRTSLAEFLEKAKAKHGDFYDYSLVKYKGNKEKVKIICPIHGLFSQMPSEHYKGGCNTCGSAITGAKRAYSHEQFVALAKTKFPVGLYNYSKSEYTRGNNKIIVTCNSHKKDFEVRAVKHLSGQGCPLCADSESTLELKVIKGLDTLGIKYIRKDRKILSGKELDIFVPSANLAIELNGNYWHSTGVMEFDHARKHQAEKQFNCAVLGINLLHFYGDEVMNTFDIVMNTVKSKLGLTTQKIAARKTEVVDVSWDSAKEFMETTHIQGACTKAPVKGLEFEGNLVAVMAFGKARSHRGNSDSGLYELIRFCSSSQVVGGCSKLLKAFMTTTQECTKIVSYSDNRLGAGGMYSAMGFDLASEIPPDYYYINKNKRNVRFHKSNFRRANLAKTLPNFDPNLTERENCHLAGYYQLFDAGKKRWELQITP